MLHAKKRNIGLLAHVDAGKTTLAERILLEDGTLRKAGRVDHGDAFLDTDETEKRRGITIYSKMAQTGDLTLIDTPGHTDFSAEMERTLQILDYAVLIISGPDGIQGHVMTLWRLLGQYRIPTVLFINKMDQPGVDRKAVMEELRLRFGDGFVEMPEWIGSVEGSALQEEIALLDEDLLERYLEGEPVRMEDIQGLLVSRKLFPCWFGSALRGEGTAGFVDGIRKLFPVLVYPDTFAARVYKVTRDSSGKRLTWMKITGGQLQTKQVIGEEKAEQILVWSGVSSQQVPSASAGEVVAVAGLENTRAGMGLGNEEGFWEMSLEPVLNYQVCLPENCDVHDTFLKLKTLEDEMPELHLAWDSASQTIHARVMGPIQIEILTETIEKRFGMQVTFGAGRVVYKETINGCAEGIGHYEPLRHYAEVHLLLEGLEEGSGLVFDSAVDTDTLALNWQRLVLTHLEEKIHTGVLTGAPVTDMRITLIAGKAHEKHTEGGDFRQSVYRAVRQGLMQCREQGRCVLLEPVYDYRLEIPDRCVGRAIADLQRMNADFSMQEAKDGTAVLTGNAPVALMQNYPVQVSAYTGGEGRLWCRPGGYQPCHNSEQVIEETGYDPDADTDNPSGSVFCAHGAGFFVPWDQVPEYAHLRCSIAGEGSPEETEEMKDREQDPGGQTVPASPPRWKGVPADVQDDEELMSIFQRTYGSGKKRDNWKRTRKEWGTQASAKKASGKEPPKKQYLLIDGYNIIFAWEELAKLAKENLDAARMALADLLANYQGYRKMTLILVFDAYLVEGGTEHTLRHAGIHVVFTKEAETADAYIERAVKKAEKNSDIIVATSDAAEQMIIWGEGARRMSAKELREEIELARSEMRSGYLDRSFGGGKRYLFADVEPELKARLEKMRLG